MQQLEQPKSVEVGQSLARLTKSVDTINSGFVSPARSLSVDGSPSIPGCKEWGYETGLTGVGAQC